MLPLNFRGFGVPFESEYSEALLVMTMSLVLEVLEKLSCWSTKQSRWWIVKVVPRFFWWQVTKPHRKRHWWNEDLMVRQQRCVVEPDRETWDQAMSRNWGSRPHSHLCCSSSCSLLLSAPGFLWVSGHIAVGGSGSSFSKFTCLLMSHRSWWKSQASNSKFLRSSVWSHLHSWDKIV